MPQKSVVQRIQLLAKPRGSVCDLDLAYRSYLNKEQLYLGSRFRMSDTMPEIEK